MDELSNAGKAVVVVPDIHGDLEAFNRSRRAGDLLERKLRDVKTTICLGDYVDRGIQGKEVLEYIQKLRRRFEKNGRELCLLMGNHEAFLYQLLLYENENNERKQEVIEKWENNGGSAMDLGFSEFLSAENYTAFAAYLRDKLTVFMEEMKLFHREEGWLFVHGGISAGWAKAIKETGIDRLNYQWAMELDKIIKSNDGELEFFKSVAMKKDGPLWLRPPRWLEKKREWDGGRQSPEDLKEASEILKRMDIHTVVMGHTYAKDPIQNQSGQAVRSFLLDGDISYALVPKHLGRGISRKENKAFRTLYIPDTSQQGFQIFEQTNS